MTMLTAASAGCTAWVPVERVTDLTGPAFFFQRLPTPEGDQQSQYACLALEPTRNRVEAHIVESSSVSADDKSLALLDLDGAEVVQEADLGDHRDEDSTLRHMAPTDVMQVWVATRVLDTPSTAPRFTLRSAEVRFLTGERTGGVSSFAEARGPLEEWTLVKVGQSGGHEKARLFALQSAQGTYLGIDQVAGGKRVVRSDFQASDIARPSSLDETASTPAPAQAAAVDVDEAARWHIRVQWKFRHEARKQERGEAPLRDRDPTFKRIKNSTKD